MTDGNGSYSTTTRSAASTACARVSATTAATMSPTNRTLSVANTGRFSVSGIAGNCCNDGRPRSSPPAWYTATTPGIDNASVTSTETRLACATVDRTNATCAMFGSTRSSTYFPAPVNSAGSSRRRTAFPRIEPDAGMGNLPCRPPPRRPEGWPGARKRRHRRGVRGIAHVKRRCPALPAAVRLRRRDRVCGRPRSRDGRAALDLLGPARRLRGAGLGGYPLADPHAHVRSRLHRRLGGRPLHGHHLPPPGRNSTSCGGVATRSSRPGGGTDVIAMVLDTAVDWSEVAELLTESYCIRAAEEAGQSDRPAHGRVSGVEGRAEYNAPRPVSTGASCS